MLRIAALLLLTIALWKPEPAAAVSPPPMPLPPCVNGEGACVMTSEFVTAPQGGALAAGAKVLIETNPTLPACDFIDLIAGTWAPTPCYTSVASPSVVSCGYIDLANDNVFRETSCVSALYRNPPPSGLFQARRPAGTDDIYVGSTCGAQSSFNVYGRGGPALTPEAHWSYRGPRALACELTFIGPRPDGLYGPTWVKVRVGITHGREGQDPPGAGAAAEVFIPIDGDLRDAADLQVGVAATLSETNWDAGRLFATYKATVTNTGVIAAENSQLAVRLPNLLMYVGSSGAACGNNKPEFTPGGSVTCLLGSVPGGSTVDVELEVRILNATDFDSIQRGERLESYQAEPEGLEFTVAATNDLRADNNRALGRVPIPFRDGSFDETRNLMTALAPYFNYFTTNLFEACNTYKDEIVHRLTRIHAEYPEVFANLSWGPVTSGQYSTGLSRAGHVGVVVYAKGTNYRRTGIVINGTPSPSPLSFTSEIGPDIPIPVLPPGARAGWTAVNGLLLRTPADKYPGTVQQEAGGTLGFEGRYPTNESEFAPGAADTPPAPAVSCPAAPNAVAVGTNSPVELVITNPRGQKVETRDGLIVTQQLDGGIFSVAFPHQDGTYAWTVALPLDDYDIKVVGTRTGAYRLTRTTFDPAGNPVDVVTDGFTNPGQTDEYRLEAAVTPPPPPSGGGGGGGGGAVDAGTLLGLALLAALASARRPGGPWRR
jgi:hypothetical protein